MAKSLSTKISERGGRYPRSEGGEIDSLLANRMDQDETQLAGSSQSESRGEWFLNAAGADFLMGA